MNRAEVAWIVKKKCAELGWSAGKLAEKAGISRETAYGVMDGKKVPRIETLGKIATALGMPVAALTAEPGYEKPPAYYLGYAYGLIESVLGASPTRFDNALNGMAAYSQALVLAHQKGGSVLDKLTEILGGVDTEIMQQQRLDLEQQGLYLMGYYAYRGDKGGDK